MSDEFFKYAEYRLAILTLLFEKGLNPRNLMEQANQMYNWVIGEETKVDPAVTSSSTSAPRPKIVLRKDEKASGVDIQGDLTINGNLEIKGDLNSVEASWHRITVHYQLISGSLDGVVVATFNGKEHEYTALSQLPDMDGRKHGDGIPGKTYKFSFKKLMVSKMRVTILQHKWEGGNITLLNAVPLNSLI